MKTLLTGDRQAGSAWRPSPGAESPTRIPVEVLTAAFPVRLSSVTSPEHAPRAAVLAGVVKAIAAGWAGSVVPAARNATWVATQPSSIGIVVCCGAPEVRSITQ